MVRKWPPSVWHGVIDPVTGKKLPPTRCRTIGCTDTRGIESDYCTRHARDVRLE